MSAHEPIPYTTTWWEFGPLQLDALLLAARDAFIEAGYHGASVRDIASRAGVSIPTIYYHHGSKQGLLVALTSHLVADLDARTRGALAGAGSDPVDAYVDLVDCTVRFMCYRHRAARLDAEARYLDPEPRAAYAAPRKLIEERFLTAVRTGIEDGAFSPQFPVEVNRALLGSFQAISTWYRPDGPASPDEIAERYVQFSLDAMQYPAPLGRELLRRVRARPSIAHDSYS